MSETLPTWQSIVHVIILHPTDPRILLVPGPVGWSLPQARFEGRLRIGEVAPLVRQFRQTLGLDTTALRWTSIHTTQKENGRHVEMICTLESNAAAWVPPDDCQWVDRATLEGYSLAQPGQREVLITCLRENETNAIPVLRPPWERRGWFSVTSSWIHAQLAQAGSTLAAPIEQVRLWGISCILRVPTTTGTCYFKASPFPVTTQNQEIPLLFANEAALTKELAALYPDHIPSPLAVDTTHGWMLLEDFGPPLKDHPVAAIWVDVLHTFSEMQLASTSQVTTLLAAGCLDRRMDTLPGYIDLLMSDAEALSRLNEAEVEQLQTFIPRFKAMCHQLASYHIPHALVHGDLHPGNIALRHGKPVFFDWTDACVSHPFFDAITFWQEADMLPEGPDIRSRLRDVYLAPWTVFEPIERLKEALALAEMLGMLHQAISYQHITANMEALWKAGIGNGLVFWLRVLLRHMAQQTFST